MCGINYKSLERRTMFGKIICNDCNGNGYRVIFKDADEKEKIAIDCNTCNNQGEIKVDVEDLQLDITPERTQ
jgi:ribosomal protein S27E